jgi:toxin ParE1/3/4
MSGFVLHPEALADLDEIWEFIATDSVDAADQVLQEIHESIRALDVRFPQHGHTRPDIASRPLKFQVVREFLIAYAPDEDPLVVIAVLHGRRNPRVLAALLRDRK